MSRGSNMFLFASLLYLFVSVYAGGLFECDPTTEGGGCSVFCKCQNGMTCEAWYHACRKPGKKNAACHVTKPCGEGLTCEAGRHICRGPGEEGDACHATRPCGEGLTCEAGHHVCRKPGVEDDACHVTKPCGSDLFCQPFSHVCKRMADVGETCVPGMFSEQGIRCNYQKKYWCDPITKKCLPPSGEGEICGYVGAKKDDGTCEEGYRCQCDTACSIKDLLDDLGAALNDYAATIQDWSRDKKFCCKCVA